MSSQVSYPKQRNELRRLHYPKLALDEVKAARNPIVRYTRA